MAVPGTQGGRCSLPFAVGETAHSHSALLLEDSALPNLNSSTRLSPGCLKWSLCVILFKINSNVRHHNTFLQEIIITFKGAGSLCVLLKLEFAFVLYSYLSLTLV